MATSGRRLGVYGSLTLTLIFSWKLVFKFPVSSSARRMVVIRFQFDDDSMVAITRLPGAFFTGLIFEPGFKFSRPAEFGCK